MRLLQALGRPTACEFRHASWFDDSVYEVIKRHRGAMVVTDEEAAAAVRELEKKGVRAGASGAASLAGALVACTDGMLRARLGITPHSKVAVVNTEGATDPASYAAILAG